MVKNWIKDGVQLSTELQDGYKNWTNYKVGSKRVVELIGMFETTTNHPTSVWRTQCDCGAFNIVGESSLKYNESYVCKMCMHTKRSFCEPVYLSEYILMKTKCGYEYFIDFEDYELIKPYTWHKHKDGYLRTRYSVENGKNKYILLHNLLFGRFECISDDVDHINRKPWDNRRCNLRIVTHCDNMKNINKKSNNTSGIVGVHYSNNESKWKAYITHNCDRINLGTFLEKKHAIVARLDKEFELYGLDSQQSHLFVEYNIVGEK